MELNLELIPNSMALGLDCVGIKKYIQVDHCICG